MRRQPGATGDRTKRTGCSITKQQRSQQVKVVRVPVIAAVLGLAALLPSAAYAPPISIDVAGSWFLTIGPGDLIAGAGSNLTSTYDSNPNQVSIAVTNATGLWEVDVSCQSSHWDNALHLWVRRTGNGVGSGFVFGGTAYLQLSTNSALFFMGWRDRTNIPVQLRLTGVSVQLPPDTYLATVTYTVIAR